MTQVLMAWLPLLVATVLIAVIAGYISRWLNRDKPAADPTEPTQPAAPPEPYFDTVPMQEGLTEDAGPPVTVAQYPEAWQAQIARINLEQAGIPVFVADGNIVQMEWYYSNAVGGVKVQVPESCVEEASAILAQPMSKPDAHDLEQQALASAPESPEFSATQTLAEPGIAQAVEYETPAASTTEQPVVCPACGSTDVYRTTAGSKIFFLSLLVGLILPVAWRRYECSRCHTTWR